MATVYYWEYSKSNVGHLSLALNNGCYISHWPESVAKAFSLPDKGHPVPSLEMDIELEEKQPDESLIIPAGEIKFIKSYSDCVYIGSSLFLEMIDIDKMKEWWHSQTKRGTTYHFLISNCAQMVYRALCVGGILREIYPPSFIPEGLTPGTVIGLINRDIFYYKNPGLYAIHSVASDSGI